ncbi:5-methylcytosine restriction system specificity protein McrC [Aquimarina muelleri]|uniref:5-methylcytosine restriction system specificity protein McrC n=1 Tax=Aquimarina muelleri TaxID=279356 RepID=UPI003F684628
MLIIPEQYGYKEEVEELDFKISDYNTVLSNSKYSKFFIQNKGNKGLCYELDILKDGYKLKTSYFIGVDWIVENKLSIYVQSKVNTNTSEINLIGMLFEALQEPENLKHLDFLCEIHFDKPTIEITQKQDLLSPLLIVQFLTVLKRIVQKGLKKSYYPITENLNSKVKGKILINKTIIKNHSQNKMLNSYCKYDVFGFNSIENKILKKALLFSQKLLKNINSIESKKLEGIFNYILPTFTQIDTNVRVEELKAFKSNPLFKEYDQAIKLAKLILRRYGYNIEVASHQKVKTPPFWIDMSKLFELYVYKKLRDKFPLKNEVIYHKKFNYQEPDYILNSKDGKYKMVIEAKYKPSYKDHNINKEDARQVSGYARLKKVYDELKIENTREIIDCLIIYSDQSVKETDIETISLKENSDPNYIGLFKKGISLPIIQKMICNIHPQKHPCVSLSIVDKKS